MEQVTYNGLTFEPYIRRDRIEARIKELGKTITEETAGKKPLFLVVLNGAFPFASDLFREVKTDAEIAFIRLKSYEGTSSTGSVKQVMGLTDDIKGRTVIVVEDIVDTGLTAERMIADLMAQEPASLKFATLLYKPESSRTGYTPDYAAFTIPPKFILGYGLDLDGKGRNLPDIYACEEG